MNDDSTPVQQEDPEYPPAIILREPGDTAEGTIERYSKGPNKFDPETDTVIAVLRQPDGTLGSFWLNSTVTRSQFARERPKPGERIVVTFKGKREGASAVYNDYSLELPDRDPYEPDWSAFDDDGEGMES